MDLDRTRREYQNRFHVKKNRNRQIMSVAEYQTMIRNLPTERLLQQQRTLLQQPSLQDRMKEVKNSVAEDEDIPLKDKKKKIEEKYNEYVMMTTDDALERKLINEELARRPATTGGMRPIYYPTTYFKSI